jgi:hypothetical protein
LQRLKYCIRVALCISKTTLKMVGQSGYYPEEKRSWRKPSSIYKRLNICHPFSTRGLL